MVNLKSTANFDGICKVAKKKPLLLPRPRKILKVDAIAGPVTIVSRHIIAPARRASALGTVAAGFNQRAFGRAAQIKLFFQRLRLNIRTIKFARLPGLFGYRKQFNGREILNSFHRWLKQAMTVRRVPVFAAVLALFVAFGGGAWAALSASPSAAEEVTPAGTVATGNQVSLGPISTVSNDVLFNMTIGQLEDYLNSVAEDNRQVQETQNLAERKTKLMAFLQERNSPLAKVADVIAEQKHWKLILAISFAESTLGKNCVDNNCSNIGVKPGHPAWHKYASLAEWVVDFNRLLEKKYSDWTLEEMNGVYVQPKNPNWLLATRQILQALQEKNIE